MTFCQLNNRKQLKPKKVTNDQRGSGGEMFTRPYLQVDNTFSDRFSLLLNCDVEVNQCKQ